MRRDSPERPPERTSVETWGHIRLIWRHRCARSGLSASSRREVTYIRSSTPRYEAGPLDRICLRCPTGTPSLLASVLFACGMDAPGGSLWVHRCAAPPGLGSVSALCSAPSTARGSWIRRIPVWVASRLRCGPHCRRRRYGAFHVAEGQEALGRRILFFPGTLHRGTRAGDRDRIRGDGRKNGTAVLEKRGGHHRCRGVGHLPLDHRYSEFAGAAGYLEDLAQRQVGNS